MLEELSEMLLGPWGIAAALLVGAGTTGEGRKLVRKVAKGAIKAGFEIKEKSSDVLAEAKEQMSDLVAEAKAEKPDDEEGSKKPARAKKKS